jgi:hypothetical protein
LQSRNNRESNQLKKLTNGPLGHVQAQTGKLTKAAFDLQSSSFFSLHQKKKKKEKGEEGGEIKKKKKSVE